ncbi:hypothetical protein [Evansella clarkii]|uniref:hypothetical protein n=1 Tax=Evansella clarkii TaxID=79879 RepID=UPI000B451B7F|nr:hypothetical protein [Evansella clarkii]
METKIPACIKCGEPFTRRDIFISFFTGRYFICKNCKTRYRNNKYVLLTGLIILLGHSFLRDIVPDWSLWWEGAAYAFIIGFGFILLRTYTLKLTPKDIK